MHGGCLTSPCSGPQNGFLSRLEMHPPLTYSMCTWERKRENIVISTFFCLWQYQADKDPWGLKYPEVLRCYAQQSIWHCKQWAFAIKTRFEPQFGNALITIATCTLIPYLDRYCIVFLEVCVVHGEVLDQVRMVDTTPLDALKLLLNRRYLKRTTYM